MDSPETADTPNDVDHDNSPETPSKRANSSVSVSQTQKEKIDSLSGGRCLVTNSRNPPSSLQYAYIVSTTTPLEDLRWMETVWWAPRGELELSSPRNVVHLSCDWHVTFNRGYWALVPVPTVVLPITLRYLKAAGVGKTAYPNLPDMLQSLERNKFYLVFFEPLSGHVYRRVTNEGQTEFDEITVDETGISLPFEHYCHPYFAIWNALSKFRKHEATLSKQQKIIHMRLEILMNAWTTYFAQVKDKELDPSRTSTIPPWMTPRSIKGAMATQIPRARPTRNGLGPQGMRVIIGARATEI